jgi:hypothetical protein
MPNEKLRHSRPHFLCRISVLFVQDRVFATGIYYFYIFLVARLGVIHEPLIGPPAILCDESFPTKGSY